MNTPTKNLVIGSDSDTRKFTPQGRTTCIVCGESHPNTYGVDRPYVCEHCNARGQR